MKKQCQMLAVALFWGILGIWNGHLALLEQGQRQPLQVFPYSVTVFPKEDQLSLKKGIPYTSEAELSRLLEDFLS